MDKPSISIWRPATTYILIGGLVALLVASVIAYIMTTFQPTTLVRVGSGAYHVWVADTEAERVQGLSGVKELSRNGGLLMDFQTDGQWGIWMKDMYIPLDIIWLNSDKKVVYLVANASPELSTTKTFAPKDPSRYVIELPAGSIQKAGIRKGMTVEFDDTAMGASL
jgi:uncharacterized membrane protein (UPF0127 family)